MNDITMIKTLYIGVFQAPQPLKNSAYLSCQFDEEYFIDCILQDTLGRRVSSQTIKVGDATKEIQIDTTRCQSGEYHVWIYVNGTTFVRKLQVEKAEQPGLIAQIKRLFA